VKHLLINGCSYAHCWPNYKQLGIKLNVDRVVNLARPGSSNDRIIRTTFEYVNNNLDIDFIILMLSYNARYEGPWRNNLGNEEGSWISYTPMGISMNWQDDKINVELAPIEKYIQDKFVYDHNMTAYTEKTLINLILLTTWLDSKRINYCIFNTCDEIYDHPGFNSINSCRNKLDLLLTNKKVIDLRKFLSNQWMYDQGAVIPANQTTISPMTVHYDRDGYGLLNNFLYDYIKENCL